MSYHTIVTHARPHIDELHARWQNKKFGGVEDARIVYWKGGVSPDGRSADEYESEGFLLLGVGGGDRDEHPSNGSREKSDDCCATLAAKKLGIENEPALEKMLRYVLNNDTKGVTNPFDIADITQAFYEQHPNEDHEKIAEWVMFAFDTVYGYELRRILYENNPDMKKPRSDEAEKKCDRIIERWLTEIGVTDPAAEKIVKFSGKKEAQPFDLKAVAIAYYEQYFTDGRITDWIAFALNVKLEKQRRFLATKTEFEEKAKIEKVFGPAGKLLTMVTIESDNELIGKFARSEHGCGAAIIIQKNSRGNVAILTNHKFDVVLDDVAQVVNLVEQRQKGKVVTNDWKTLRQEGRVPGSDVWYFHRKLRSLLNGSLTAPDTPPTKISLDEIRAIVKTAVNPLTFEPKHAPDCKQGRCTSTPDNPCSWYVLGLQRCRQIRFSALPAKA